MELRARKISKEHRGQGRRESAAPAAVSVEENSVPGDAARFSIRIRYDTLLHDTLQNMIRSSHTAQDFTYPSLADFLRAALKAYKGGMALTEQDRNGIKLETSLRVDRELWLFYKSLPGRMRSKILERVIRTFMQEQSKGA